MGFWYFNATFGLFMAARVPRENHRPSVGKLTMHWQGSKHNLSVDWIVIIAVELLRPLGHRGSE